MAAQSADAGGHSGQERDVGFFVTWTMLNRMSDHDDCGAGGLRIRKVNMTEYHWPAGCVSEKMGNRYSVRKAKHAPSCRME